MVDVCLYAADMLQMHVIVDTHYCIHFDIEYHKHLIDMQWPLLVAVVVPFVAASYTDLIDILNLNTYFVSVLSVVVIDELQIVSLQMLFYIEIIVVVFDYLLNGNVV
eukprot:TRINITY_DN7385_c0_g1_i1.p1 TRINITY_DN7385_c0_g1~~TRINITY_DN7385_c0_g1_i1.p1  ORF type:complete len:107 (+),score=11.49 TRINITY_DN7385_c0_g1_i1:154-474(+)